MQPRQSLKSVRSGRAGCPRALQGLGRTRLLAAALALLSGAAAGADESVDCVIKPSRVVAVSVQTPGILATVEVERGDRVRAGDVLARQVDGPERAQLAIARRKAEDDSDVQALTERLQVARAQFERLDRLRSQNLATLERVERAESDLLAVRQDLTKSGVALELAQLEYQRAKALHDRLTVRSPIVGLVTDRQADGGEFAAEETPILTLSALDPLLVEAYLPASLYGTLAVGDRLDVVPEGALPAGLATIKSIDAVFEAISGTFFVTLSMPNADGARPAGLRCSLQLPRAGGAAAAD